MVTGFLRRLWVELLIAVDPMVTLEGFELTGVPFVLLPNSSDLEPALKRKITICNLFVNQRQSITAIARVLDTGKGRVVNALIEEGIIKERRRAQHRHVRHERRRPSSTFASPTPNSRTVVTSHSGTGPTVKSKPRFQTLFGAESAGVSCADAQTAASTATSQDSRGTDGDRVEKPVLNVNSTLR